MRDEFFNTFYTVDRLHERRNISSTVKNILSDFSNHKRSYDKSLERLGRRAFHAPSKKFAMDSRVNNISNIYGQDFEALLLREIPNF